jgi:hypothetical protein
MVAAAQGRGRAIERSTPQAHTTVVVARGHCKPRAALAQLRLRWWHTLRMPAVGDPLRVP